MTMNITHAMVLAAGLGTRMRPITDTIPKPLVPVAGKCLVDYALDQLQRAGVQQVVVNSAYKAELLEAHVKQRSQPNIHLSREVEPLETGGGIRYALPKLGSSPFFCLNSDTICLDRAGEDTALQRMQAAWDGEAMDVLMLLQPVEQTVGYQGDGDFAVEGERLRRRKDGESVPYVFTGVQLLHPRLFEDAPTGAFSMNLLYNRHQQADGTLLRVGFVVHQGDWLHVGDPQALQQAEAFLANQPALQTA